MRGPEAEGKGEGPGQKRSGGGRQDMEPATAPPPSLSLRLGGRPPSSSTRNSHPPHSRRHVTPTPHPPWPSSRRQRSDGKKAREGGVWELRVDGSVVGGGLPVDEKWRRPPGWSDREWQWGGRWFFLPTPSPAPLPARPFPSPAPFASGPPLSL